MKRLICLCALTISLAQVARGINNDSLPCLKLSARIEPTETARPKGYSIELWSELELVSVMNSEKGEVFRFDLKKNTQYTILVMDYDSVVKKVFINTNIPWDETSKSHKLELVLGFPDPECNSYEEESRRVTGTINFNYETKSFFYKDEQFEEKLADDEGFDITKPKY